MASTLAVIDYGMGNLRSVAKALEHVAPAARVHVTQDAARIRAADRVVFPGQGAIGDCIAELARLGLDAVLREVAATRPLLGICLGPQALLEYSEENGGTEALGILPGRVQRFAADLRAADSGRRLKVPHMGWNRVRQAAPHPLWDGIADGERFYFVHSYFMRPAEAALVQGRTDYGLEFASAIGRDNIFAVQFHPEKSAQAGLRLLANFVNWDPR